MKTSERNQTTSISIATPDGRFLARYGRKGLVSLDFPGAAKIGPRGSLSARQRVPGDIRRWHRVTVAALKQALAGRQPQALPPLDLSAGTELQRRVWRVLRKIGRGQTRSYGEIARAIGRPKTVRAVGGACGANPIPVLVPCHRVLAINGKIGGFSGGLDWKRTLLKREGVRVQ
jgi:O-6-methylguanine DNA methyltransferase